MTTDLDTSTRPNKWVSRGFQPEVILPPKPPLLAINALAAQIREESDPTIKAELEGEFARQAKALDAVTSDPTSAKLKGVIDEITAIFEVIVDPPHTISEQIEIPECMSPDQWITIHKPLIECKRTISRWVSISRKFATVRWGIDYVAESEYQMTLALGIEVVDDPPPPPQKDDIAFASAIGKRVGKWDLSDVDEWNPAKRDTVLTELRPIVDLIDRIRSNRSTESTVEGVTH